jgi:tetratricopeptide (TPR) repeat protein
MLPATSQKVVKFRGPGFLIRNSQLLQENHEANHHITSTPTTNYSTMDPADILRSVIYNNEGFYLVEHGLYDDAIVSFTQSLEILLQRDGVSNSDPTVTNENDATEVRSKMPQHRCISTLHTHLTSRTTPKVMRDEFNPIHDDQHDSIQPGFVFRDPIEIPFDSVAKTSLRHGSFAKLSIIVMYNLALAFHLSALQKSSLPRLKRARKLYELAFQMHLKESSDVTLLFSLALMNNLALIYDMLGEHERSKMCFTNLLATMMFLLESNEAHSIKQWDGLLSNVMGLIFTETEVAASAA